MKKTTTVVMTGALILSSMGLSVSSAERLKPTHYMELNGSDRYETSVKISKEAYTDSKVKAVVVASGEDFPDALAGGPLAASLNGPLLLTKKNSLSKDVLDEIDRLKPRETYILGGKNTISDEVINQIKNNNDNVQRIFGNNRYETSMRIAEKVRDLNKDSKKTIIVNGKVFADALSAGALGAKLQAPLLLTDGTNLPDNFEKITSVSDSVNNIIVGGSNSVNIQNLQAERISGVDRFDTSAQIAKKHFNKAENIAIASGLDYPDGLSSISLYNKYKMPILLTSKSTVSSYLQDYIKENKPKKAFIIGGLNSIDSYAKNNIIELMERSAFKLAKPEIIGPLEAGSTYVTVRLTEVHEKSGMVQLYKINEKEELVLIDGLSYGPGNNVGKLINYHINLKKGDRIVARAVESENTGFSDFTDIFVVGEEFPDSNSVLKKLSNIKLEMAKDDTSNTYILKKFEEKAKELNYEKKYEIEFPTSVKSKEEINNGMAVSLDVTVKSKVNSGDVAKGTVIFRIDYVKNDLVAQTLSLSPSTVVNNEDRVINYIATFSTSGTVNANDLVGKLSVKRANSTEEDSDVVKGEIIKSGDTNIKYNGSITVKKGHPVGKIVLEFTSGKDNLISVKNEVEVVENKLESVSIKDSNGGETTEFAIPELNKAVEFVVEPKYTDTEFKLRDTWLTATVESIEPGEGVTETFDKSLVEVKQTLSEKKYTISVTDKNTTEKSHTVKVKLVYNDGENSSVEKTLVFKYVK